MVEVILTDLKASVRQEACKSGARRGIRLSGELKHGEGKEKISLNAIKEMNAG